MKILYPALVFLLMSVGSSRVSAQSVPAGEPFGDPSAVAGGMSTASDSKVSQSAAERAIDWLDKQISPPGESDVASGGSFLSDPDRKRSFMKTAATLTLVVSLFLSFVFLMRMRPSSKRRRRAGGGIPDEVVSVLGQVPFVQNQQLQLIRLGSRLLLVSTSQAGSHTLGEITDPEEVFQIETSFREGHFGHLKETLRRRAMQGGQAGTAGLSLGSHQRGGRTLLEA